MLKLIIPVLLLITSLVFAQKKDTYDLQKSCLQKSGNSYLDYDYKTIGGDKLEATLLKDGFFTIGTSNGTSDSQLDDNCQITYGHPFAKTSFPSIKLDGVLYKYDQLFTNLSETELLEVSINGSQDEVSTSPIIHINNYNEQLNISLNISIDEIANRIVIQQIITNIDAESHTIQPNITFDPALGKHGDGIIPLSGAFLTHEETFSPIDLLSELIVFEKGTGALGMGISFDYNGIAPETVSAQNWIGENTTDYQQETLYDLLLKFEWEEVEVSSGEIYTTELIVNILEPSFGDVFARLDIPSALGQVDGIIFPNNFNSFLELANTSNISNFEIEISSIKPIKTIKSTTVSFKNSTIEFIEVPITSSISYEDIVSEITVKVKNGSEVFEQITKHVFVPSTPKNDTGLLIVNDSISVNSKNVDLFFEVQNESTGWPITNLSKDNVFLFQDEQRIGEYNLEKYLGGGSNLADVVFVLDISGSMGNEITQVRNYLNEFADSLRANGFDFQIGVVTFSTTVDNIWDLTNNTEEIRANLASINLWGGVEDSPSALMAAANLSFRPGSMRNIIWITDEAYPEDIYTAEDVVQKMLQLGITVHSVSLPELQTEWSNPITIPTGGDFFDISGNFRDILIKVSNMEAENLYKLSFTVDNTGTTEINILLEIHHGNLGVKKYFTSITSNQPGITTQQNALLFYPNPFNPEINFDITHENFSDGQIRIYNVLGQCVKEISFTKAATQSLKWNARNQINSLVGTGFYIVQLALKQNGNIVHHESAKILYLK